MPSASHTLSNDNGHEPPLVKNQFQASLNELRLRRLDDAAEFLHDVDRVGQHREHQALFARERARADHLEELAAQDDVRKRPRIGDARWLRLRYSLFSFLPPPSEELNCKNLHARGEQQHHLCHAPFRLIN